MKSWKAPRQTSSMWRMCYKVQNLRMPKGNLSLSLSQRQNPLRKYAIIAHYKTIRMCVCVLKQLKGGQVINKNGKWWKSILITNKGPTKERPIHPDLQISLCFWTISRVCMSPIFIPIIPKLVLGVCSIQPLFRKIHFLCKNAN